MLNKFFVVAVVVLVSFLAYTPTVGAMSKGVGERILGEYVRECMDFDLLKYDKNSKTQTRCARIRVDLQKGAECDFGTRKARPDQIGKCEDKVNKLAPASSSGTSSGGTGGSGGSGGTGGSGKEVDKKVIASLGEINTESVQESGVGGNQETINSVLNIVFSVAGALAFMFIVIGGFRFILSKGDPQATAQARSTVLYALIGLVVVMFAYAIVRFIVESII